MELVKSGLVRFHHGVALPRLGNHHHHRMDEVVTTEVHELEGIIKAGGIRSILIDDGENARDLVAVFVALAECLTGFHEIGIPHDRVDLAVVGDETVGMGARPAREGVRRETGVHQRKCRLEIRVVEVREILRELAGRQHALVDHRPRGEVGDVKVGRAGEGVRLVPVNVGKLEGDLVVADRVGDTAADDVELALESPSGP